MLTDITSNIVPNETSINLVTYLGDFVFKMVQVFSWPSWVNRFNALDTNIIPDYHHGVVMPWSVFYKILTIHNVHPVASLYMDEIWRCLLWVKVWLLFFIYCRYASCFNMWYRVALDYARTEPDNIIIIVPDIWVCKCVASFISVHISLYFSLCFVGIVKLMFDFSFQGKRVWENRH